MTKSIILLSGGLDSAVALGAFKEDYNIQTALTFNYGQQSFKSEASAARNLCNYYKIEHKVINLDWLGEITETALVSGKDIPTDNLGTKSSAEAVWVPNRNGLFLNIAASFADAQGYKNIIFGANKDEGQTFPDNTEEFREQISRVFETSTLVKPRVVAPLINCTKSDIVKIAIERAVPLEYVRSCYYNVDLHCGKCESCMHLKKALEENNCYDYIKILFEG